MIPAFDAAYTAYNDFQHAIERYWTIRWLAQQEVTVLEAVVMKEGLVRAETLPLVFKALGCESLPRGTKVRVRLAGTDALTLDVHASLVARLDGAGAAEAAAEEEVDEEDAAQAAPIALAIEVNDEPAVGETVPTSAA